MITRPRKDLPELEKLMRKNRTIYDGRHSWWRRVAWACLIGAAQAGARVALVEK